MTGQGTVTGQVTITGKVTMTRQVTGKAGRSDGRKGRGSRTGNSRADEAMVEQVEAMVAEVGGWGE
jgi:hypothetical protein